MNFSISNHIRYFRRKLFFFLDRFKIPRSERRVLSLLLLAVLLVWTARLFIQYPQWIDPSIYEEEQALFRQAFASSHQEDQEIKSRYGLSMEMGVSDLTVEYEPTDTLNSSKTPIQLNTATLEQLMSIPGIGPSYAEKIMAWRNKNGAFTSLDQLLEIKGIGEKRLEKLKSLVTITAVDSTGENR